MERLLQKDVGAGPHPQTIAPLRLVQTQLDHVRSLMVAELVADILPASMQPLMEHIEAGIGKMIRPGLVLLSGLCVGRPSEQHLRAAAIMEMLHQATLLHDDVLDGADTRRRRPAANRLWGNAAAVLLGDWVLSKVLRRCLDLRPDVSRSIADMALRVCQGELRQTLQRSNWQITEAEYLSIIEDKSASFFSACCRAGVLLAEGSPEQADALAEYGLNVGMAFQLADDLLDITAQPHDAGKSTGQDLGTGTVTLAMIHLRRTLGSADQEALVDGLHRGEDLSGRLQSLMAGHGSFDYVRGLCRRYAEQAARSLDAVGGSQAKLALAGLAQYSFTRKA